MVIFIASGVETPQSLYELRESRGAVISFTTLLLPQLESMRDQRASFAIWRVLGLFGCATGMFPVLGWPRRCAALGTVAAAATYIASVLVKVCTCGFSIHAHVVRGAPNSFIALICLVSALHLARLTASHCWRRGIADTNECLRLYCERHSLSARGHGATLVLATLPAVTGAIYAFECGTFTDKSVTLIGSRLTYVLLVAFLVQQIVVRGWKGYLPLNIDISHFD